MITIGVIVILIISVIIHEIAHGYVALRLGDPTAKNLGRLSLNPISHIDLIGTILLPGLLIISGAPFLFGWAKPVPINTRYFTNPLKGMMLVAIAGPLSNISIAMILSLCLKFAIVILPTQSTALETIAQLVILGAGLNIALAIFNMIPIPPLDGSRVLAYIASSSLRDVLNRIEPYGFVIILVLAYINAFDIILPTLITPILRWIL